MRSRGRGAVIGKGRRGEEEKEEMVRGGGGGDVDGPFGQLYSVGHAFRPFNPVSHSRASRWTGGSSGSLKNSPSGRPGGESATHVAIGREASLSSAGVSQKVSASAVRSNQRRPSQKAAVATTVSASASSTAAGSAGRGGDIKHKGKGRAQAADNDRKAQQDEQTKGQEDGGKDKRGKRRRVGGEGVEDRGREKRSRLLSPRGLRTRACAESEEQEECQMEEDGGKVSSPNRCGDGKGKLEENEKQRGNAASKGEKRRREREGWVAGVVLAGGDGGRKMVVPVDKLDEEEGKADKESGERKDETLASAGTHMVLRSATGQRGGPGAGRSSGRRSRKERLAAGPSARREWVVVISNGGDEKDVGRRKSAKPEAKEGAGGRLPKGLRTGPASPSAVLSHSSRAGKEVVAKRGKKDKASSSEAAGEGDDEDDRTQTGEVGAVAGQEEGPEGQEEGPEGEEEGPEGQEEGPEGHLEEPGGEAEVSPAKNSEEGMSCAMEAARSIEEEEQVQAKETKTETKEEGQASEEDAQGAGEEAREAGGEVQAAGHEAKATMEKGSAVQEDTRAEAQEDAPAVAAKALAEGQEARVEVGENPEAREEPQETRKQGEEGEDHAAQVVGTVCKQGVTVSCPEDRVGGGMIPSCSSSSVRKMEKAAGVVQGSENLRSQDHLSANGGGDESLVLRREECAEDCVKIEQKEEASGSACRKTTKNMEGDKLPSILLPPRPPQPLEKSSSEGRADGGGGAARPILSRPWPNGRDGGRSAMGAPVKKTLGATNLPSSFSSFRQLPQQQIHGGGFVRRNRSGKGWWQVSPSTEEEDERRRRAAMCGSGIGSGIGVVVTNGSLGAVSEWRHEKGKGGSGFEPGDRGGQMEGGPLGTAANAVPLRTKMMGREADCNSFLIGPYCSYGWSEDVELSALKTADEVLAVYLIFCKDGNQAMIFTRKQDGGRCWRLPARAFAGNPGDEDVTSDVTKVLPPGYSCGLMLEPPRLAYWAVNGEQKYRTTFFMFKAIKRNNVGGSDEDGKESGSSHPSFPGTKSSELEVEWIDLAVLADPLAEMTGRVLVMGRSNASLLFRMQPRLRGPWWPLHPGFPQRLAHSKVHFPLPQRVIPSRPKPLYG
ncbi:hypothetical protein CBR_g17037 [Chara braunii]|uniref:Uncharacterized protein n=1 Tax=Chara braunii TaxID=69332 RepID=A0A388KUF1_CHABU|nr:hypothetical protein CBR_g17037 [Chara braunii]|eukprot:GBG73695.1 hypothetical protein CBR_g17037 [Chara braunii]